jgi:hypothetical protein
VPRATPKDSLASANDQAVTLADIASPRELAAERPDVLTEEGLRWLIRQRRRNGLSKAGAVLLIRNRAVLVRSRFERWLAEQIA